MNTFFSCLAAIIVFNLVNQAYFKYRQWRYFKTHQIKGERDIAGYAVPTISPEQQCYIKSFIVIEPSDEVETAGEILHLSLFGEYCPKQSLRGYSLNELLADPKHYKPNCIVQKGVESVFV